MTAATYRPMNSATPSLCSWPASGAKPTFPHGALNTPTPSRGSLRAIPNTFKQRAPHMRDGSNN